MGRRVRIVPRGSIAPPVLPAALGDLSATVGGLLVSAQGVPVGPIDPNAFYVATDGVDTLARNGSISQPWRTPAFGAAQLTTAGKTLYIRSGTYDVDTPLGTRSCALYQRANNCTISGYPLDPPRSAILRGAPVGRGNHGVAPTGGVIGVASVAPSGGWISNLTIVGMVLFDGCRTGTRANRLEDCDCSVGGDVWSGIEQGITIWLDDAYQVEIVNNYIHDSPNGVGGANGMLTTYDFHGLLIEQNTFKRPHTRSIVMKDYVDNVTIRRNFFYDSSATAIWTGNNVVGNPGGTVGAIYQNIITKVPNLGPPYGQTDDGGGFASVDQTGLLNVYNNVFDDIDGNYGDLSMRVGAVPVNWFNNIHSRSINYMTAPYAASQFAPDYLDYNLYGGASNGWVMNSNLGGGGVNTSSLATWKTYAQTYLLAGADVNSVSTSPGFLNASGNFSLPTDFKRSSYTANGRGGAWPSVMGAYITGNEQIGATFVPNITVYWTAPTTNTDGSALTGGNAISTYRVSWYKDGYFVNSVRSATSPATITGLSPGTYSFYVTAIAVDNEESDPYLVGTKVVS
jgi:hypothetical protein